MCHDHVTCALNVLRTHRTHRARRTHSIRSAQCAPSAWGIQDSLHPLPKTITIRTGHTNCRSMSSERCRKLCVLWALQDLLRTLSVASSVSATSSLSATSSSCLVGSTGCIMQCSSASSVFRALRGPRVHGLLVVQGPLGVLGFFECLS